MTSHQAPGDLQPMVLLVLVLLVLVLLVLVLLVLVRAWRRHQAAKAAKA